MTVKLAQRLVGCASLHPPYASFVLFDEQIEQRLTAEEAKELLLRGVRASDLAPLGITVDCAPVCDVRCAGTHESMCSSTTPEA